MATVYFTNNADSGEGSLRAAISAADPGDVITYDDTAFASVDTIVISLSSWLILSKEVTIDGRAKRIALDGQGTTRILRLTTSATLIKLDILRGSRSDGPGGVLVTSGGTGSFEQCRLCGCYGGYTSSAVLILNGHITLRDSHIAGNMAVSAIAESGSIRAQGDGTATLVRCTAVGNTPMALSAETEGMIAVQDSLVQGASRVPGVTSITPSAAGFVAPCPDTIDPASWNNALWESWDFRLTPESPYLTGAETDGDVDLLGHPRKSNGALGASEGAWLVGSQTITTSKTVDYCELFSGDLVEFQGAVDTILRIAEGATVDGAEFTATNRSYFVTPPGTETGGSTFTNVVPCSGVAGISDLVGSSTSATAGNLTWSQQNSGVPVLVESKNTEDEWETVSATASSPFAVSAPALVGSVFRIFDGATFASVTIPEPFYDYAVQYQVVGGFRTHNVDQRDWRIITYFVGVVDMDSTAKPGQAITLLARIYDALDNDTPLLNDSFNITNVVYTVEKRTKSIYLKDYTPVLGHENVEAGPDCVLSALTVDDGWDLDGTGYNFILTPSTVANPIFPEPGQYRVKVTVSLNNENPITFYHEIHVNE